MPDHQPNGRHRVSALADLFETLPPANRLEAEDELRAAGRDPNAIGREFAALAATRLGIGHQQRRARRSWRAITLYPLAASLVLSAVGWYLIRGHSEMPPPPSGARLQSPPALSRPPHRDLVAAEEERAPAAPATVAPPREMAPKTQPVNEPYIESPGSIEPGTVITAANLDVAVGLLTPGVEWAVRHGMQLHVVAPRAINPPAAYRAATGQYSAPVRLAADGTLENYVAGLPFPQIDPHDPQAALKIMWNFTHNSVATDDLDVRNIAIDTGPLGPNGMDLERHITIEYMRRLFYTGRLHVDPRPALPNVDRILVREQIGPLREPSDLKGVITSTDRYLLAERQDDTWLYMPSLRRVRRLSASQRSDGLFGQDIDPDSIFGFNGQLAWMDWRLLGEKDFLACMHARHDPVQWGSGAANFAFDDSWEVRRGYVVEARSKLPQYAYGKRVLLIDKETWTIPISSTYDRDDRLWKVWISMSHPRAAADGGETLVTPAGVMLDLLQTHGTRVALANASDSDWRVNQGESGGVREEMFAFGHIITEALGE